MNDQERFEEIEDILSELDSSDSVILIEGNKDRRALDNLGLNDAVTIEVQREGGPLRTAERLCQMKKDAIILTDWDDRGDRLASQLSEQMDALCVRYDTKIRSRLRDVCIKDIKDVESLDSLYGRLKDALTE